jgi:GNAT superfamily N-acetyltransferase
MQPVRLLPLLSMVDLADSRKQQAGAVNVDAFADEPLFRWLHPQQTAEHYEALCAHFAERVRKVAAAKGGPKTAVLALLEGEGGEEMVVGLAVWTAVAIDIGIERLEQGSKYNPRAAFYTGIPSFEYQGFRSTRVGFLTHSDTAGIPQFEPQQPPPAHQPEPALNEARWKDFIQAWGAAEVATNQVLATGKPLVIDIKDHKSLSAPEAVPVVPRIELTLLATAPKHQGKGVGSALLDWGVNRSDELKVPVVIGASDVGRLLYLRRGFSDLGLKIVYASEDDEKRYGRLNDDLLVRWPSDLSHQDENM